MRVNIDCTTCREHEEELLLIMRQHLQAERDVYDAAFVQQNLLAMHQANLRVTALSDARSQLRLKIDAHWLADHGRNLNLATR